MRRGCRRTGSGSIPRRFAARIAGPLKALADPAAAVADGAGPADAAAEAQACGGPLLDRLQQLQSRVIEGRWQEAVKLFHASGRCSAKWTPPCRSG